jgi:hypothetical protein
MPVVKLPLGGAARIRGMTGRDEDILTNRKKLQSGEAVDEIMANCVEALGSLVETDGLDPEFIVEKDFVQISDILRLKTPDRMAILQALRIESFGEEMDIEFQCECGEKSAFKVDLTKAVSDRPLPGDYNPDYGFEVKLSNGQIIQFDYMSGNREKTLAKQKDNLVTMGMLARLGEVENVDKGDRRSWLLNLPVRFRSELRKLMVSKDCGPDTNITADCTHCDAEHRIDVQGQPGFFFPAA